MQGRTFKDAQATSRVGKISLGCDKVCLRLEKGRERDASDRGGQRNVVEACVLNAFVRMGGNNRAHFPQRIENSEPSATSTPFSE